MSVETQNPMSIESDIEQLKLDEKLKESEPVNASATSAANGKNVSFAKSVPRKLPFEEPSPLSTRPSRLELTAEEEEKYNEVLEHMKSLKELPTSSNKKSAETAPLSDWERYFLTRECILRYLRATKWNVHEAKKRLEGTIIWRREYGTDTLTAETIEPEAVTGKQMLLGFDNMSRPCLYLIPSRQNTNPSPRQIQQLVYSLERAVDMMPQGVETLALLVDFKHSSNSKNPSPRTGQQVLHILQTHYPERLGKALVINVPTFVWIFFKLITPFIDPLTREKLKFNENLREYVPPEQLYTLFGGDLEFEYEHETFWPAYLELASNKRKAYFERWKALGGEIGLSEWDIRVNDGVPETNGDTITSAQVEDHETNTVVSDEITPQD